MQPGCTSTCSTCHSLASHQTPVTSGVHFKPCIEVKVKYLIDVWSSENCLDSVDMQNANQVLQFTSTWSVISHVHSTKLAGAMQTNPRSLSFNKTFHLMDSKDESVLEVLMNQQNVNS